MIQALLVTIIDLHSDNHRVQMVNHLFLRLAFRLDLNGDDLAIQVSFFLDEVDILLVEDERHRRYDSTIVQVVFTVLGVVSI